LLQVSFYNVARSLTILFNVVFTYFMLNTKTSQAVLASLGVVVLGFFLGSEGEVNFSLIGTLFGVTSSCFVSLNSIFTKRLMPVVDNDKWRLAFYNNVNASFLFFPLMFMFGEHRIIQLHAYKLWDFQYWLMMSLAGVLGFLIGIVTVMQITFTSPLTHNISGTAKACLQTILAYTWFKNAYTLNAILGLGLVLVGSLAYAIVRMREEEMERRARTASPTEQAVLSGFQKNGVYQPVPTFSEEDDNEAVDLDELDAHQDVEMGRAK